MYVKRLFSICDAIVSTETYIESIYLMQTVLVNVTRELISKKMNITIEQVERYQNQAVEELLPYKHYQYSNLYLEKCFTDAGDDLKNGETIWKDVYLPSPFRGRHDTFKQAPKTSGSYTLELLKSRDLLLHSWPKRRSFLHRLY